MGGKNRFPNGVETFWQNVSTTTGQNVSTQTSTATPTQMSSQMPTQTHQNAPIDKFRQKYRIESTRLKNYDYSSDGAYFITICTKNREHFFGEIIDGQIQLSKIGKIVADEWGKTAEIRKNFSLGQFIAMPNHIHGVLIIHNDDPHTRRDVLPKRLYDNGNTNAPKRPYGGQHPEMSAISPTKNTISVAIRFLKRQTTILAKQINPDFAWQSRFYDRIIRNEDELYRIERYIVDNPLNWEKDRNNSENIYM